MPGLGQSSILQCIPMEAFTPALPVTCHASPVPVPVSAKDIWTGRAGTELARDGPGRVVWTSNSSGSVTSQTSRELWWRGFVVLWWRSCVVLRWRGCVVAWLCCVLVAWLWCVVVAWLCLVVVAGLCDCVVVWMHGIVVVWLCCGKVA